MYNSADMHIQTVTCMVVYAETLKASVCNDMFKYVCNDVYKYDASACSNLLCRGPFMYSFRALKLTPM